MEGFLHSDLNSFYASVEVLHHPHLKGKPVAVVGDPEKRHGILLAATREAKAFGIKTAMPVWQVRQLCPQVTLLPARIPLYMRYSRKAHKIYAQYTDRWEPYGPDEAFLDVRGSLGLFGTGGQVAQEIRARFKRELGLTVSIGVSFNKTFAKLGSDYKKPDAVTIFPKNDWQRFIFPLPVGDLMMVGPKTEAKLRAIGVTTIGGLANTPEWVLQRHFKKWGSMLWVLANGLDVTPVAREHTQPDVKSIGNGCTTPRDLVNEADIHQMLCQLSDSVAARLREGGFAASTVEVGIRDVDLYSFTRQQKLPIPTDTGRTIGQAAFALFKRHYSWAKPVRSISVRASGLAPRDMPLQTSLEHSALHQQKLEQLDGAVDSLNRRWPGGVVRCINLRDGTLSGAHATQNHEVPMPTWAYG